MSLINGVVIGLVTNVADPEKQGRIKVHFPWLDDQHETDWVRIATMMAGGGRGSFFIPEVNDEVLVAFDHGEARIPYVIGFLWNGQDAPPDNETSKRTLKSTKGHTILLDDKDGDEKIVITSSSGHKVELDDTPAGQTMTVQTNGGQKVVLDDKTQSIELRGGSRQIMMQGGLLKMT